MRRSGNSTKVCRVNRNVSAFAARAGVLNDASSNTISFSWPLASSKKPAFFVYSPYADSVIGFVRSTICRSAAAPPGPKSAIGSSGASRAGRNRISFFVPKPFVRFFAADPSSGSSHRS